MRIKPVAIFIFVALVSGCVSRSALPSDIGIVTRVVDGDTLIVKLQGRSETLRLIGVNTPETVHPNKPVECFGPQASDYAKSILKPKTKIRLQLDLEPRDKYSRLLVYVFLLDGTLFNEQLLLGGFATTMNIAPNIAYASRFDQAQQIAKSNAVGMWQAC